MFESVLFKNGGGGGSDMHSIERAVRVRVNINDKFLPVSYKANEIFCNLYRCFSARRRPIHKTQLFCIYVCCSVNNEGVIFCFRRHRGGGVKQLLPRFSISHTIKTRATRRRVPCKWRQICRKRFVFV